RMDILYCCVISDEEWHDLGFAHLAQAASLRETVLVPLSSSGRMLGYLQASNHSGGKHGFSKEEMHLLTIVANQAAPIIENATLVQQTRQRAQRAEALRRIASLASSVANLDEILLYSLKEMAHLLQADSAAAFLVNSSRTTMQLHVPSRFGDVEDLPGLAGSLPLEDAQFPFTAAGSMQAVHFDQLSEQQAIIPFYHEILKAWEIESAIVAPLVIRDQGIGELWLGSHRPGFFEMGDLQALGTAAGQLAGVVEQSYLASQTDESLRRRIDQLTALTRISRELSASIDLNSLLQLVYEEALRATRADCGSLLLFNLSESQGKQPVVHTTIGDHAVQELHPLEIKALESGETLNFPDLEEEGLAYPVPHADVKSVMVVPVLYRTNRAGLIRLHSRARNCFDSSTVEIARSLAAQAAIALSNAFQHEEQIHHSALLQRELETLQRLFQMLQSLQANQPLEKGLAIIAQAIQEATPFRAVLVSLYHAESESLVRVFGDGFSSQSWEELQKHRPPWQSVRSLLADEFRFGGVYFIPYDRSPVVPPDVHTLTILDSTENAATDAWHPEDILAAPLYDHDGDPLGLISLDDPSNGRRPDRPTLEALELFAMQAALFVMNDNHQKGLADNLADLDRENSRLTGALALAQERYPLLLHKELESTITNQGLHRQIERVYAGLQIVEASNHQDNVRSVLHTIAVELMTRLGLQSALIAERRPAEIRLVETVGEIPADAHLEALFGQRNPLRHLLQDGQQVLMGNLDDQPEWKNNPLLNALSARSLFGFRINIAADHVVGILGVGASALPAFSTDDLKVYTQLSHQVSIRLQNLQLLGETRRRLDEVNALLQFNRKLDRLNPVDILSSLVETILQLIPNANASWAAVWSQPQGELLPRAALGFSDNQSLLQIHFRADVEGKDGLEEPLPVRVYKAARPAMVHEIEFARDYKLSASDLILYHRATGGKVPVSSLFVPIYRGDLALGLLVIDNYAVAGAFSSQDENMALSLVQQTALALQNASLFIASEQRAVQLQALTQVAGAVSSSLKSDELIASVIDHLKNVLPYDTATLWLRQGEHLSVAAVSGFTDEQRLIGLSVAVEDSALFQEMGRTGEAISVPDVAQDPRFAALVEPEYRSWLGIPLVATAQLTGVLALEKGEADFYTTEHIQIGVTFASQVAVALENARLFEDSLRRAAELDDRSQRLALLNRLSNELVSTIDMDTVLGLTAHHLQDALNASRVVVVLLDDQDHLSIYKEYPEFSEASYPQSIPDFPLAERLRQSLGIFNAPYVDRDRELAPLLESFFWPRQVNSVMMIPLTTGNNLFGWIWLLNMQSYRFSSAEIELAVTICNQAAAAVQNARLYAETRSLKDELEQRVEERTSQLRREHQNTQTLLNTITELSNSLDMDQVLNRTLSVINESMGVEYSLIFLSGEGLRVYQKVNVDDLAAYEEEDDRLEFFQKISDRVVRDRKAILIEDLTLDPRWDYREALSLPYRSVIAVPLVLGESIFGSLLIFHHDPGYFKEEQVLLSEATARQMSIALNNAELFKLIQEQASHLGNMARVQQIEASRSRAILEAVADGVLVTDESSTITLFNASAESILGLSAGDVVGQPLEHFSGLFGKAAQSWMFTIDNWSSHFGSTANEIYAEQIVLDDQKVVAVSLAPVTWRSQFLGTVSIFRDISHEVLVDRLKSEFIANISHELRTPMTSIKGYVEIMLMGVSGTLNPQQTRFLQIVKGNTERLTALVNGLLDISRIESGRINLAFQPVDLREVAEDVVSDILRRSREENKLMSILLDIPGDLPAVRADFDRARQVLANLISNGYNYTPAGGEVRVRMRRNGSEVQVEVRDNGIGISARDQGRIFERFYRGEDPLVLATAGTGLGLSLSKTLIEMHSGKIWFYNNGGPGEGSTFCFTLPVYQYEGEEWQRS
ncbi:MAG: GAF domain-containing protein, partial [Anaerolineaceae bacterium]|nr:GAF domain-containing protein [Anaerolineaceae bacterium]